MSFSLLLANFASTCIASDVNQPYEAMQRGFAERDPAVVASAYHDETAIGGLNPPRIRTEEELPSLFGYVAPEDGSVLAIDFRITERDVGETLGADIGLYRITGGGGPSYGGFTTILSCGEDRMWRFTADLMRPADEETWNAAECVDGAPCAQ